MFYNTLTTTLPICVQFCVVKGVDCSEDDMMIHGHDLV